MISPATITASVLFGISCLLTTTVRGQTDADPTASKSAFWLGNSGADQEKARAHLRDEKAARQRWELATTLGDYERVGQKDPRWDTEVRAMLEHISHALAQEADGPAHSDIAKPLCQSALDAGCKDPLVGFYALRNGFYPPGTDAAGVARLFSREEETMEKSGYSPLRKLWASFRAAEAAAKAAKQTTGNDKGPAAPPGTDLDGSLARGRGHLVELLAEPTAQRDSVYAIALELLSLSRRETAGKAAVFEPLEQLFDSESWKETNGTAAAKLVEGTFWIDYAWLARTSKWASEVTQDGWQLFGERLAKAEDALTKAYELEPDAPAISCQMMTVELGQGKGRERMEQWFRRAMDADPDSYDACARKMSYLEPKWYGDANAVLAFADQCMSTENWKARIPFVMLQAYNALAGDKEQAAQYWKRPEIWSDIQALFKGALAAKLTSPYTRSSYALYAYRAEQWQLADDLLNELGDKADLNALQCTREELQHMRDVTASKAGDKGTTDR